MLDAVYPPTSGLCPCFSRNTVLQRRKRREEIRGKKNKKKLEPKESLCNLFQGVAVEKAAICGGRGLFSAI